jgi:hypothetical protein
MTRHYHSLNAALDAAIRQLTRSDPNQFILTLGAMVLLLPLVIIGSWLQRDAMPGPNLLGATVLITLANVIAATAIAALWVRAAAKPKRAADDLPVPER